jgi:hypothetical protein
MKAAAITVPTVASLAGRQNDFVLISFFRFGVDAYRLPASASC